MAHGVGGKAARPQGTHRGRLGRPSAAASMAAACRCCWLRRGPLLPAARHLPSSSRPLRLLPAPPAPGAALASTVRGLLGRPRLGRAAYIVVALIRCRVCAMSMLGSGRGPGSAGGVQTRHRTGSGSLPPALPFSQLCTIERSGCDPTVRWRCDRAAAAGQLVHHLRTKRCANSRGVEGKSHAPSCKRACALLLR